MLRAIAPRMPVSGMTVPGCGPVATATAAATAGCSAPAAAAATSARRIRPPRPEPRTWLRSTPSATACRRTSGEAGARVCSSTGAEAAGAGGAVVPAASASSTSSERIRPPGPVPRRARRSTPRSLAIRLALGEAGSRPAEAPAARVGDPLGVGRGGQPPRRLLAQGGGRAGELQLPDVAEWGCRRRGHGDLRGPLGRLLVSLEQPRDQGARRQGGALVHDRLEPAFPLGLDLGVHL